MSASETLARLGAYTSRRAVKKAAIHRWLSPADQTRAPDMHWLDRCPAQADVTKKRGSIYTKHVLHRFVCM